MFFGTSSASLSWCQGQGEQRCQEEKIPKCRNISQWLRHWAWTELCLFVWEMVRNKIQWLGSDWSGPLSTLPSPPPTASPTSFPEAKPRKLDSFSWCWTRCSGFLARNLPAFPQGHASPLPPFLPFTPATGQAESPSSSYVPIALIPTLGWVSNSCSLLMIAPCHQPPCKYTHVRAHTHTHTQVSIPFLYLLLSTSRGLMPGLCLICTVARINGF